MVSSSSSSAAESSLEDRIADTVLRSYDALPAKFKPMRDANGLNNWVPLSGIVLTDEKDVIDVVAVATGMKCLPSRDIATLDGGVLHDSHAEIIAIRLFNHFLLSECLRMSAVSPHAAAYESPYIVRQQQPPPTPPSQTLPPFTRPFAIRAHWKIWLYSSEAPCGDASMELVMAQQADATPWTVPSPSPPIPAAAPDQQQQDASADTPSPPSLAGRGYFSQLGAVRRKPGRADAPSTLSKSCSDKLALKQCTSLLSAATSLLVAPPSAYLDVLLLPASQFSATACERAFGRSGRMAPLVGVSAPAADDMHASVNASHDDAFSYRPFDVRTTAREFRFSRRADTHTTDGVCAGPASKASNVASAHSRFVSEVIIGGVRQGHKREAAKVVTTPVAPATVATAATASMPAQAPGSAAAAAAAAALQSTRHRGASKLSRRALWGLAAEVVRAVCVPAMSESVARAGRYSELKTDALLRARNSIKDQVRRQALTGWMRNAVDDFELARVRRAGVGWWY